MKTSKTNVMAFLLMTLLFGGRAWSVNMETVFVGNLGNAGELSGSGAGGGGPGAVVGGVNHTYQMGKY